MMSAWILDTILLDLLAKKFSKALLPAMNINV